MLTGVEFTNQRILGSGFPVASQGSKATVLKGRVWFAGPNFIIGAGTSPTAVKWDIN